MFFFLVNISSVVVVVIVMVMVMVVSSDVVVVVVVVMLVITRIHNYLSVHSSTAISDRHTLTQLLVSISGSTAAVILAASVLAASYTIAMRS